MADKVCLTKKIETQGPVIAGIKADMAAEALAEVQKQLGKEVSPEVAEKINKAIEEEVAKLNFNETAKDIKWWYGQHCANWVGYYDYYKNAFEDLIKIQNEKLWDVVVQISDLHWFIPLEDMCIISRKPEYIKREDGKLHCENGSSLRYKDGFSLYSLNGVTVPKWLAELRDTEIDPARIKEITNVEVRREFVRKVGYDRIFHKLQGKVLDKQVIKISNGTNDFEHIYEVVQIDIENNHWNMLKMINPSISSEDNIVYHIEGVPNDCETVEQAIHFRKPEWFKEYPVSENGKEWFQQGDVVIAPEKVVAVRPLPIVLT